MTADFAGRAYFVSGAAKGIGRAIAAGLSARGATVALADIDRDGVEAAAAAIVADGGDARAYVADLGLRDAFHAAVDGFVAHAGGLDGMVNNASYLVYEPVEDVTEERLNRMLGAGLKSVLWGSQALIRHRREGRPAAIVNFSSPVAYRGYPHASAYSAIKSASASFTRTMAAELGPRGIRVNAVAPGSVPTPGALRYVDEAEYARRAATIPMRRLGRETDIVAAVCFLLGDEASFINGAVLAVDGGIIAAA